MKKLLCLIVMFLFIPSVNAYTKQDILDKVDSIKVCDSDTQLYFDTYRIMCERLLNERKVSDKDLNKIYTNLSLAYEYVKNNNFCSVTQVGEMTENDKEYFKNLFTSSINILKKSPKIDGSTNTDINITIDPNNKEINVYDGNILQDKITITNKLNYVGINKIVIYSLAFFIVLLIINTLFTKNKTLRTSINNVALLFILIFMLFGNKISNVLDILELMNVEVNTSVKEVMAIDKTIVSYPGYNTTYGVINILDESEKIYFGDSADVLKRGVGQATNSYLPGEGKNTILSGHNTKIFKNLADLKSGSKVTIETTYGKFIYQVYDSKIVSDTNMESLQIDGENLIMYTCYPNNTLIYTNQRLVVYAKLIDSKWVGES